MMDVMVLVIEMTSTIASSAKQPSNNLPERHLSKLSGRLFGTGNNVRTSGENTLIALSKVKVVPEREKLQFIGLHRPL